MKNKLNALLSAKATALAEAEKFIQADQFEEAKAEQAKVKSLIAQIETVQAQIDAQEAEAQAVESEKVTALQAEVDALKAAAKNPVRLEDMGDTPSPDPKKNAGESVYAMRFGETPAAVKAVIADLYGSESQYHERRSAQMDAFVKYIRLGETRLTGKEADLLAGNYKNILLRPDVVEAELKTGRSVAEIKATLVEGSLDLGGYLVPEDYRASIIKRMAGNTVVRGRARIVTTTRDAVEWPKLEGGNTRYTSAVRVNWVEENPVNASAAETNPTFGMLRIPIHTVMARTDLSRNLLEDSAFNMLDVLSELFSEAMRIDEDEQFLTGTGGGKPLGILGARSGAEYVPVTGVAVENTGNASALTADGLLNLVYGIASQYRDGAVFVMNRTSQRDARKLKDGNGRYYWQDSLVAGQPATLLGYPVLESEAMPSISANNHPIIFGNLGGYIVADRVGMSVERVTDSTLVGTNKVAIFARRRLGGELAEPWRQIAQKVSA